MNADKIADLERKISGYRCAGVSRVRLMRASDWLIVTRADL